MFKHVVHLRMLPNIQQLMNTKYYSQDNKVLWMVLSNILQFLIAKEETCCLKLIRGLKIPLIDT